MTLWEVLIIRETVQGQPGPESEPPYSLLPSPPPPPRLETTTNILSAYSVPIKVSAIQQSSKPGARKREILELTLSYCH